MVPPGLLLDNRYRLDSPIAAGGMGEVWQGTDLILERRVAVKLLRSDSAEDAEGPVRFRAEARHAGLLSHPNIAQVFDYSEGDEDGQPYLVMELVAGPSLARVLEDGPVGPAYTMAVTAQVCAGLAAAHTAGLVHRDIKPGNLLINEEGLVKITDFGIAQAAGVAPVTRTGVVIGTWAYLAPERAAGAPAGPSSDLYSLGVVAYECLTGQAPFAGDPLAVAIAHQDQGVPPLPPTVPDPVAELVADLTAKDPRARPPSAAEVAMRAEQLRIELAGAAPTRPDLPMLAGAFVRLTGQGSARAAAWTGEETGRPTRRVAGLRAGSGSGDTTPGPARPFGWIGSRMMAGLAAAVVVLAGLVAWTMIGLRNHPPSHAQLSARTPAARHSTHHHKPATAGPSDLGSVPAVEPTQAPSPTPSASPSPRPTRARTGSPSQSPTTPPPSETPTPPETPTPTPTNSPAAG